MRSALLIVAALSLVMAACASPAESTSGGDRTIAITGADDFSWTPAEITVHVGDTVTFEVTNEGNLPHDFFIGDEAAQDHHEMEMASGEMHEDGDEPAISIAPGETATLVYTFDTAGELLYGCHVAGHYAAGMVGTIHVES